MKIGFIGLGIMGKPMVRNLIKAGHELVVFNRSQPAIGECVTAGAAAAKSAADVGAQCGIVITMVPNSPEVRQVLTGENGVLDGAKPGTICIDMSSIAPIPAREIAALCEAKGVDMLDAPVSGGEPGAIDGTLTIMVGGRKEIFDRVRDDVLLKMGAHAVYCGTAGAGSAAKLANQVILSATLAGLSEAFTLVKKAGVDPATVLDAIRGGMAGSRIMEAKVPMMIADSFKPGFKMDLHMKDLQNAIDTGHDIGSPLPVTAQVMEMYQTLHADGHGDEDHSTLSNYYAKMSGVRIGG